MINYFLLKYTDEGTEMFKWLEDWNEASPQTKYFIITVLVFSLVIIVSVVYCFARLDFVRTQSAQQVNTAEKNL